MFLARVYVTLKSSVNDPQGSTVLASLRSLGFESPTSIRIGKFLEVQLETTDRGQAEREIEDMCDQLLANPVIEEFRYELTKVRTAKPIE